MDRHPNRYGTGLAGDGTKQLLQIIKGLITTFEQNP